MFKKLLFGCVLVSLTQINFASALDHPLGCPVGKDEKIVCSAIMCDFGLVMGEWPSECNKVKADLAVYLTTLGFLKKKPARCYNRDENCIKDGTAKRAIATPAMCSEAGLTQNMCELGVAINNADCDELTSTAKQECIIKLARDTHSCSALSASDAFKCMKLEENEKVLDSGVYGDLYGKIAIRFGGELVALDDAVPAYLEMVRVNDSRMDFLGRSLVLGGFFGPEDCPILGGALKAHCNDGVPLACWGLSGHYGDKRTELGQCVSREIDSIK